MTSTKHLSTILALVVGAAQMGCAADPIDDAAPGEAPGGEEPGDEAERPVDAAGTYLVQSKFDIASSVPGTAGEVVNTLIEITDDPDDPTLWILEQAIAALPSGWIRTALSNAKPYVAGYLNDRILDLAPDFVAVAVELTNNVGQMAKGFGLTEALEVTGAPGAPGAYTSSVTAVGARFTVDGVESEHLFADHGAPEVTAAAVGVSLDRGKLAIGEHSISVSYGKVLRIGLDAAIIPMLEPSAGSLNELFASKVNCALIGKAIEAAIEVGSPSTYAAACTNGLNAAAGYIYGKLAAIDGVAIQFGKAGAAKALDKDRDGKADTILTGAWEGTISYGGSAAAPLAGATFYGARQ